MKRVLSLDAAAARVGKWHDRGLRVVFTNGCFDLLHPGHIHALESARACGDVLVVALNDDASVRRLKGEERPWVPLADRARMVAALRAVELVVPFGEDTPLEVILALRPDLLVKGEDYAGRTVVGAKEIADWGGEVRLLSLRADYSTSKMINLIRHGARVGRQETEPAKPLKPIDP
jgi:D-beta-D-heptose 7-phosphate kinase/D-beta-D-heptose 1-phosphate adenosyltransferase